MGLIKGAINSGGSQAVAGIGASIRDAISRAQAKKKSASSDTAVQARSNAYRQDIGNNKKKSSNPKTGTSAYLRSNAYDQSTAYQRDPDSVSSKRKQEESNRRRLTEAGESYDKAQEDANKEAAKQQEETEANAAGDNYKADFEAYSDANLGGMGINEFMRVDPYSQEDKDAWRAMVEDETMAPYYEDLLAEYGGFDQYWDAMTANTLADVLADSALQTQYFGAGDITKDIMSQLRYEGYYPEITGDTGAQDEIYALLEADPQAAEDMMLYNYRQNLGGLLAQDVSNGDMTIDDARSILSLDEYNDLGSYGNMQYGYGDGYDMNAKDFDPASFEVIDSISPSDWDKSIEKQYTSLPGYGLASVGNDRALAKYLYDAGYQEQEGVPELWASYLGEDTGEDEEEA